MTRRTFCSHFTGFRDNCKTGK